MHGLSYMIEMMTKQYDNLSYSSYFFHAHSEECHYFGVLLEGKTNGRWYKAIKDSNLINN